MMRYEINPDTLELYMWDGINEEPFLYQPDYPDTTPWGTYEAVEAWAIAKVEELTNPDSEYVAGPSALAPVVKREQPQPSPTI